MAAAQLETITEIRASTTHVVVEFNILKQKSSELVLRSWMFVKKGIWYCRYPTGANMQFVESYVRDNAEPEEDWKSYKVKILTQADNYDQGIRRLDRYLDGADSLNSLQQMPDMLKAQTPDIRDKSHNTAKKATRKNPRDVINRLDESCDDTESVIDKSDDSITAIDATLIPEEASSTIKKKHNNETLRRHKENNARLENHCSHHEAGRTISDTNDEQSKDSTAELRSQLNKIERKLARMERNILYELKDQFHIMKTSFVSTEGLKSVGDTIPKCLKLLGTDLPLNTLEEFLELDKSLKYEGDSEEEKKGSEEKRKALKTWMKLMWNSCKVEKDAVYKVLPAIMTKPVQLQFSGAGRKIKGQGKENFSATQIFECMTDILVESFPCNKDSIRTLAGKWLAGAADRDGGKKNRSLTQDPS